MDGEGVDNQGDNEVAGEGEMDAGGGGNEAVDVGEASEGTITGGTLSDEDQLSRYDKELYHLE